VTCDDAHVHRSRQTARRTARRTALAATGAVAASTLLSWTGSLAAASYFARRVLTPDPERPDDVVVVAVADGAVTLAATVDTVAPGCYGLWLDGGAGHARLGDVLEREGGIDHGGTVTRKLLGVDSGRLEPGPARWNQYFYAGTPQEALQLPTKTVQFASDVGDLEGWLVPPAADPTLPADTDRWAVLVHGRGARREECLRALPALHELGYTSLIPLYRNDVGAPPSPDGRYNLGLSEWKDLEAAMLHAIESGAQEIVLFGWSMGGAIVLQALDLSWLSDRVTGVVLDAPVIDWADVLRHQAAAHQVPGPVELLSRRLIGRRAARRLVGVHDPIDVARTDWVSRADELSHPMLLIHSEDDEFVPVGPSAALAARRPDLVRYEPWQVARHTKEWNVDPGRWDRLVREFLTR
jgi:alpha-beta hydrolase superfamily lysophospholipase